MSTLRQKRRALVAEVRYIGEKATLDGRDFTAEEVERVTANKAEVEKLDDAIERAEGTRDTIKAAFSGEIMDANGDESLHGTKGVPVGGTPESPMAKAMIRAVGEKPGGMKSVTVTAGSVSVNANLGIVPMTRYPFLLQNIVTFAPQDGTDSQGVAADSVSYLEQTDRTLAAAAVERGAPKQESALAFDRANQAFATLAHVITVPNQWLSDGGVKFQQLIQDEMLYGLALATDDLLLSDTTDENGGTLHGLLTKTGVGETDFTTDAVLTVRAALGSLEDQGILPSHVAMSPATWRAIETMRLTDNSYLLPDRPAGSGQRTLWNTKVALVNGMAANTAIAGDFTSNSIGVVTRGPVTLQWNPYSKDTTNETILRVEGRFTPVITRPGAFTVAALAAA
ncbi:phage major capsid protein [Arthrobacter sp. NPDC058288]|uniref:phage major capsid protein n=1 Tax=Arthrobacter sp. NPDC058288 TaxID=3346424 RepID=UPI0036E1735C